MSNVREIPVRHISEEEIINDTWKRPREEVEVEVDKEYSV